MYIPESGVSVCGSVIQQARQEKESCSCGKAQCTCYVANRELALLQCIVLEIILVICIIIIKCMYSLSLSTFPVYVCCIVVQS